MGTESDWLPIIAAISSRWWYPWTLYASHHSSNGKSASRVLEVGCRGHERPILMSALADAISHECVASLRREHALRTRPFNQTNRHEDQCIAIR